MLALSFGFGVAFQIPLIVNALIQLEISTKIKLKSYRGLVLILCFIFGMIFTPPDIISQFLILMITYVILDFATLMIYGLAAEKISFWLKSKPKILNTISACVLLIIAIYVAATQNF